MQLITSQKNEEMKICLSSMQSNQVANANINDVENDDGADSNSNNHIHNQQQQQQEHQRQQQHQHQQQQQQQQQQQKQMMVTSQLLAQKEEYEAKLLYELSMSEEKNQYMAEELTSLKNVLREESHQSSVQVANATIATQEINRLTTLVGLLSAMHDIDRQSTGLLVEESKPIEGNLADVSIRDYYEREIKNGLARERKVSREREEDRVGQLLLLNRMRDEMDERERLLTNAKNKEMKAYLDIIHNKINNDDNEDRESHFQLINEMKDEMSKKEREMKDIIENNKKEIENLTFERNKEIEKFQINNDKNQNSILWSQWFEQKEGFDNELNMKCSVYENEINCLKSNIVIADSKFAHVSTELRTAKEVLEEKFEIFRYNTQFFILFYKILKYCFHFEL